MTVASTHDDVEDWVQGTFGLTLDNYPAVRGVQVRGLLEEHPRSTWDALAPAVVAILSIPETHFLRHPECFDALSDRLRQLKTERPEGPVRLWSAGCASGEEAYNLAAVGHSIVGERIEVFGTDFSPTAVEKARKGVYGKWSLRGHDRSEMPWLGTDERGGLVVGLAVRNFVTFEVGQLAEPGPPSNIDVAFCRNVLIYFSDEGGSRVLDRIASSLRPDGVLVMAPTDPSPSRLKAWTPIQLDAPRPVRAYRPPAGGSARPYGDPEPDLAQTIRALLGR
ncbi:MAG: CheR family methyltransferase [Myxococcota bacterium]